MGLCQSRRQSKKHGVGFEEATTCFDDPYAVIFADEDHADDEPREILIGYSTNNRLVFVSFVQRSAERVRIISTRRADAQERQTYEKENFFN
jgi:uncharacterized DUF497 family protein